MSSKKLSWASVASALQSAPRESFLSEHDSASVSVRIARNLASDPVGTSGAGEEQHGTELTALRWRQGMEAGLLGRLQVLPCGILFRAEPVLGQGSFRKSGGLVIRRRLPREEGAPLR